MRFSLRKVSKTVKIAKLFRQFLMISASLADSTKQLVHDVKPTQSQGETSGRRNRSTQVNRQNTVKFLKQSEVLMHEPWGIIDKFVINSFSI